MANPLANATQQMNTYKNSIQDVHDAAQRTQGIFGKLLGSMVLSPFVSQALQFAFAHTEVGNRVTTAWKHARKSTIDLTKDIETLEKRLRYTSLSAPKREEMETRLGLMKAGLDIHQGMARVGLLGTAALTKSVSLFVDLIGSARTFNQNLIEANSSLEYRSKLLQDSLVVSASTGVGLERATRAAGALVHYGMDNNATWKNNLRIVSELEMGIGLGADQAARLAAIAENQLETSFEHIAESVVQLVEYTALSAAEAGKLAEQVEQIVASLRPGLGGGVAEVTKVLGEYESAFKRMGGQTGQVTALMERLTTIQGMPAAGMIGIYNPEFIASSKDSEAALRAIGRTATEMTAGMEGYWRTAQMHNLAEIFGISAGELSKLMELEKAVTSERTRQMSVTERFRKQTTAAQQGWSRLMDALATTFQALILPIVTKLGEVLGFLADALTTFNKTVLSTEGGIWSLRASLIGLSIAVAALFSPALIGIMKILSGWGLKGLGAVGLQGAVSAAGGIALLGLVVASLAAIYKLLSEWMEWMHAEQEIVKAMDWQKNIQKTLEVTRDRKLTEGFLQNKQEIMKAALFGVPGTTDTGMVGDLMRASRGGLSVKEAIGQIWDRLIVPLEAGVRATRITQASALDKTAPKNVDDYGIQTEKTRRAMEEHGRESLSIMRRNNRLLEERNNQNILYENSEPILPDINYPSEIIDYYRNLFR